MASMTGRLLCHRTEPTLTPYDREHAVTCMRLLDADAEGADWREVAEIALRIDPSQEPVRARRTHESHLVRAKCVSRMATGGWCRSRSARYLPSSLVNLGEL
nr:DUF2285 domain-containing protein [Bradyrhizobium sp. sGM-13]